ncbi:hypothetical protein [Altererythrobacter sp. BO-6]|uniref:hypothetical protein n=1 Tax=Altererythrobacter sp. BO-6 TaxID=2604537 RepID=UPI001F499318|nr:hypothetical protein [Altererythrobacter sp. BO-6]
MSSKSKLIAAISLGLMASACSTAEGLEFVGQQDPGFGEANRTTFAAMVVNPDPQYDAPMITSAAKAAAAIERYRTDQVKQPERVSTTEGISEGGGN